MLHADKQQLETELQVNLLAIRERELVLYTRNMRAMSTSAALLVGFSYAALTEPYGDVLASGKDAPWSSAVHSLLSYISMALNSLAVYGTLSSAMLGPGLALRGPEGSMDQAVDGLALEFKLGFMLYMGGIFFLVLASFSFVFTQRAQNWHMPYSWADLAMHLLLSVIFILFCRALAIRCRRIYKKFRLPPEAAVEGGFSPRGLISESREYAGRGGAAVVNSMVGLSEVELAVELAAHGVGSAPQLGSMEPAAEGGAGGSVAAAGGSVAAAGAAGGRPSALRAAGGGRRRPSAEECELARLSSRKRWYQWPRRTYLRSSVFMDDLLGITAASFAARHPHTVRAKPAAVRARSQSVARTLLRSLEERRSSRETHERRDSRGAAAQAAHDVDVGGGGARRGEGERVRLASSLQHEECEMGQISITQRPLIHVT